MRLLHIDASPRHERSRSRVVARAFLDGLEGAGNAIEVSRLDLWQTDLPDLGAGMIEGRYDLLMGNPVEPEIAAEWAGIRAVADHFLSFDGWLLSVPMWNFGLPYALKHYVDVVTQPGMTFTNDAVGNVVGLAAGKRMVIVAASALPIGVDGAMADLDFQVSYLQAWLGFIGVTDIEIIRVAPTFGAPEDVEAVMLAKQDEARALAARWAGAVLQGSDS